MGRTRDRLDRPWRPYKLVLSPQIGTVLLLAMFFSGLAVSWIATVFVMDGSLKNFTAEREQLEAERKGKEYMARTNPQGLRP